MITRSKVYERCLEIGRIDQTEAALVRRCLQEFKYLPLDKNVAAGLLSELHTRMRVEEVRRRHHDVDIVRLERRVETDRYVFYSRKRKPTNIQVRRRVDWRQIGEIDLVMIVEEDRRNIPVVVETHLSSYQSSASGVKKMLRPERVERKRKLASLLCNNMNGHRFERPIVAYVVPKDQLRNLLRRETVMYQFVANGGIIIPFPAAREEWKQRVAEIVREVTDAPESGYQRP